ncbi:hypothetical protein [Bacillus toyonensis]|uniref:hypothetical protein n=1 Tax=Bacillus toyonensis TaxID=155322 RepID=UPI003017112C
MNVKKKILGSLLIGCLALPTAAMAASYSSTYDMTGGVYSSDISMAANRNVTVKTTPRVNDAGSGAKIFLLLEENTWYGYAERGTSWNSASNVDTSTEMKTKSAGKYRVYLRNKTGMRMAGSVYISD